MDLKSAFQLLLILFSDFCQVGIEFLGFYYFDKCLPEGYCVKSNNLCHYYDDFLSVDPSIYDECAKCTHKFISICQNLGVPIANIKTEDPSTCITYLGLVINSVPEHI